MIVLKRDEQPLQTSNDVVLARQKVRQWAMELRFSLVDQTKLVTAASELARNALDHGMGGSMSMELISQNGKSGLRLIWGRCMWAIAEENSEFEASLQRST